MLAAEQFFSIVPWGVHECMNDERKVTPAGKPAAHSHSEGVCFPANVPIEMGHVRFTQWIWKGAYLRSRVHCLARSLIKYDVLLPPTTRLWGSHACKNLFLLTCHVDDSSLHHPTVRQQKILQSWRCKTLNPPRHCSYFQVNLTLIKTTHKI